MRADVRYLIAAILAAFVLERYIPTLAPFVKLGGGHLDIAALFLAVSGLHVIFRAVDAGNQDSKIKAATDGKAIAAELFLLLLFVFELIMLYRVHELSGVGGPESRDNGAVQSMMGCFIAIFFAECVYQLLPTAKTNAWEWSKAWKLVERVVTLDEPKEEDRGPTKLAFFLIAALLASLYVVAWRWAEETDCQREAPILLVLHVLGTILYGLAWVFHQRMKALAPPTEGDAPEQGP